MTVTLPGHTNAHDYAVAFSSYVAGELKPYNHTPDLLISNLWALVLDVCSGIETHGQEPDTNLQALYDQHDIGPLREGYLEKWWKLHLKGGLLRARGRWWLSHDPRNIRFTAEATDILEKRYRAAWRLYTAETLHQKSDRFNLDPWQKALGRLQDDSSTEQFKTLEAELF